MSALKETVKSFHGAAALSVFALVVSNFIALPANAAFIAYICDDAACSGGGDLVVTDNGAGDGSAITGLIIASGSVGGLEITVNTSQSKPVLADGMDITFTATDTGGGGQAWFYAGDTDFTNSGNVRGSLSSTIDNGSVQASLCGADSNGDFNNSPCVSSAVLSAPGGFTQFGSLSITANPYSLLLGLNVQMTAPGTNTGDFRATVPGPAALSLLGLGLIGAGISSRRRRKAR